MHAFIQRGLRYIQAMHFIGMCVLWVLNPEPYAIFSPLDKFEKYRICCSLFIMVHFKINVYNPITVKVYKGILLCFIYEVIQMTDCLCELLLNLLNCQKLSNPLLIFSHQCCNEEVLSSSK